MSKGLEALEHLNKNIIVAEDIDEDFNIIEKELKALQLSISKQVNRKLLIWSSKLEEYNDNAHNILMKLAQEEYDLLKEVLVCH